MLVQAVPAAHCPFPTRQVVNNYGQDLRDKPGAERHEGKGNRQEDPDRKPTQDDFSEIVAEGAHGGGNSHQKEQRP